MTKKVSVTAKRARALILKRLTKIRDKGIVKNAVDAVCKYGDYKFEEASCYCKESGTFEELFGTNTLKISFHSFGQFHENRKIKISFGDKIVFEAEETHWFPKDEELADKTIS